MNLKIWAVLGFISGIILAIFAAFHRGAQAGADKVSAKASQAALKQQTKATQAMVDGLTKESEVRGEKVDTDKRDHFTKQ